MKRLFLFLFIFTGFTWAQAQIEISTDPVSFFNKEAGLSGEYLISDYFSAQLTLGTFLGDDKSTEMYIDEKWITPSRSGLSARLTAKYFFSPDQGADGWGLYAYLYNKKLNFGFPSDYSYYDFEVKYLSAGLLLGKKWVFDSGFLLEFAFGVERFLTAEANRTGDNSEESISYSPEHYSGKIIAGIGYRFGM